VTMKMRMKTSLQGYATCARLLPVVRGAREALARAREREGLTRARGRGRGLQAAVADHDGWTTVTRANRTKKTKTKKKKKKKKCWGVRAARRWTRIRTRTTLS